MAVLEGNIGGQTFLRLEGEIDPTGESLMLFTAPGVDGIGADKNGKRSRAVIMMSMVDVNDTAEKLSVFAAYKALQGTLVSVTDSAGITDTLVLVLHVEPVRTIPVVAMAGGKNADPNFVLVASWELQATNVE